MAFGIVEYFLSMIAALLIGYSFIEPHGFFTWIFTLILSIIVYKIGEAIIRHIKNLD